MATSLLSDKLKIDELIKTKNKDFYKEKIKLGDFIFNTLNNEYYEVVYFEEDKINAKDRNGFDCYIKIEDIYYIDFDKTLKSNPYVENIAMKEIEKETAYFNPNYEYYEKEIIKLKEENLKLKNIIKEISSLL